MKALAQTALDAARTQPDEGATLGAAHRNRSKNFVESLAAELRRRYAERNDVAACETGQVPSATGRTNLTYVSSLVIAVESEMARNSREALYDFSKLVMGRAQTSLFVGPQVADEDSYLAALGLAADCCSGEAFVALVPHPDQWQGDGAINVRLWQRSAGNWVQA